MRGEKTSFEQLLSVMTEGWKDKAKELGALARGREIKDAFDLLRLAFLYMAEGKSFGGTAALLQLGGIRSITKRAAFTRFQRCGERLRRLCEAICRNNHAVREPPDRSAGREAYLAEPAASRRAGAARRTAGRVAR